ncbi:uncharacterized protein LOC120353173 [Nilaparvata lugens]|uniref:uncharacterized protein LOC120353173 n=1 Tax=Nilaparvata lugens TaxID=108931 RepID=UPI00193CE987|nr:uncharacterized protein LOC120353173 [Nilaparvata lugens]
MSRLRELKEANKEKRRQRLEAENKRLEELKKAEDTKQTETRQDSDSTPTQETENLKKISEPEKISEGASYVVPICAKTSKGASYVNPMCATEHNMLTPVPVNLPVPVQSISNFNPIKSNQHFNISDFESDSSPFDNMELKTLNDIAELASVLQPNNDVPKPTYQNYQSTDNRKVPKPSYHTYQSPDNQDVPKPTYQNYQSPDNRDVPKPTYQNYQSPDNQDVAKPTYQNYQSTDNRDVPKPTYHTYQSTDNNQDVPKPSYHTYQSTDNQDVAKPTYHTYQSTDNNQDVPKPTYQNYQSPDNQDVAKPSYHTYQSTDNQDVPKPTYHTYQSTDNNQDVPKPSYHTYQDNNQLYNHQSYPIKHSRTFIQQPGNLVPNNGYTYGNMFNNTSVSDPNPTFWDQQQRVSYSSTLTTTAFGVTSPYTTEPGVYTSQNSDINAVRPKIGEYRLNVGENTVYSSDYRVKLGESAGYSSDYRPNSQEIQTQNRPADNTGYLGNEYQYIPQTASKFGATSSTNNGVYVSKFGGTATNSGANNSSKFGATSSTNNGVYVSKFGGTATNSGANNSSMTTNLGANSQYAAKFGGGSASTVNLGTTNSYLMQAQGVMNSRGSETEDTSEYLNTSSDYMKPISSDYLNSKIGGSKNSVNYAQGFSWSSYNYGATNSGSQLVVNQVTKNSGSHLAENSENHLLVSENSDVTNLIRELKLELDDRRENDSRKMMQNERVIVTSVAVEVRKYFNVHLFYLLTKRSEV